MNEEQPTSQRPNQAFKADQSPAGIDILEGPVGAPGRLTGFVRALEGI